MTYSIVARDPDTGELGVAVQSHWFSVGSIVTWARPGVGAVATQANAEAAYGPDALTLLADGVPAPEVLEQLVIGDPGGASRQVAVIDAAGRIGVHTGPACIAHAGHVTGRDASCQANIMASERVWPAMLKAFEAAPGSLTARLLDALDAAERAGRRPPRAPVRRDPGRPRRGRALADGRLAARRGPSRPARPSCADWSSSMTPTGWRARPMSC